MSLAKYLAKAGAHGKRLAGELGEELAHGHMGKDIALGAAIGSPLEAATKDDDESYGGAAARGAVKGGAVNAGTMSILRRLGL